MALSLPVVISLDYDDYTDNMYTHVQEVVAYFTAPFTKLNVKQYPTKNQHMLVYQPQHSDVDRDGDGLFDDDESVSKLGDVTGKFPQEFHSQH